MTGFLASSVPVQMFCAFESFEFRDWTSELHEYRAATSNSYVIVSVMINKLHECQDYDEYYASL